MIGLLCGARGAEGQLTPRFSTLAPIVVNVGEDPGRQAIAVADLDDDGNLDLVVAELFDDRINVYFGAGDGTFDDFDTYELEVSPLSVAIGDVGSPLSSDEQGAPDGNLDIAIGSDFGGIEVLYGDGDGDFESDGTLFGEDDTLAVIGMVIDDFDEGDGNDIAVLDEDGVVLLCNDGSGGLAVCGAEEPIEVGFDVIDIVGGDFDGDGDADVAVLDREDQRVSILRGNGDGTFAAPVQRDVSGQADLEDEFAADMDAGFLNSDGLTDLVVINHGTFDANFLVAVLGAANGNFGTREAVADFEGAAVTLADFDDMGGTDAIVGYLDGGVSANLGVGNGTFDDPFTPIGTNSIGRVSLLVSGDFDGDVLPDFLALNEDGTQLTIALNASDEATPTEGPTGTPTPTITGTPPPTSTVTPTPTLTPTDTATPTPTPIPTANYGRCNLTAGGQALGGIVAAPLDGDGTPDLAVTDPAANAVRILFNTTAAQQQLRGCAMSMLAEPIEVAQTTVAVANAPRALAAVDAERDGDTDLAVCAGNAVVLLRNDGQGGFTAETPISVGTNPVAIIADYPTDPGDPTRRTPLDLNRDGRTDLVVANAGSAFLTILYGAPGGGFTVHNQGIPGQARAVTAADYDGDGRIDLVASRGTDAVFLRQTGIDGSNRSVFQSSDFGTGATIIALESGFFDENRFPDLLVTRGGVGQLQLFINNLFAAGGEISVFEPAASGIGLFSPGDRRADAVIAGTFEMKPVLQFAYGSGSGDFPPPIVMPFDLRSRPVALAVVDVDSDGVHDVVTANGDGTITVLLSSVPPPTPTPTVTPTATATGTDTVTQTPSETPTETPTATPTDTAAPTGTVTGTRTPRPGDTPTVTPTKAGIFEVSSCAIGDGAQTPLPVGLLGLALALLGPLARRVRRPALPARAGRRFLAALAASAAALPALPADAQPVPAYVRCTVPGTQLGTGSGLVPGAAGDLNGDRSADLVLLDATRAVVALTDAEQFRAGACPEPVTARPLEAVTRPQAAAIALTGTDLFPDLAVTTLTPPVASVLSGDGNGGFPAGVSSVPLSQPGPVAVAAITGGTEPDLVVGDGASLLLLELRLTEGTLRYEIARTLVESGSRVQAVGVADFNGDARLDVVAIDLVGVRVFLQEDDGEFTEQGSFDIGSSEDPLFPLDMRVADPLVTGDFNRDFIPDLAVITTTGPLLVYLGRRDAAGFAFERSAVLESANGFADLALGDLNDDLRPDIAVADATTRTVRFFLGDGSGGFTDGGSRTLGDTPTGVLLADVDADGRPDPVLTTAGRSVEFFLSSAPAPTATPTFTDTPEATETPTVTPTETVTETPSDTPTETPTATPTGTVTGTRTLTVTRTGTVTPTVTCDGFCVQGEGCANVSGGEGNAGAVLPLLIVAALLFVTRRVRF